MSSTAPASRSGRILRLRKKLGLTQVAFAEQLGVSFVTVNRWENGKSEPSDRLWTEILKLDPQRATGTPLSLGPRMELGRACGPASTSAVPDFAGDPNVTRMVIEGDRLSFGHMFNPTFAT